MRVKMVNIFKEIKLNNFNSIKTLFIRFTKIRYFFYALTWPDSFKIVLSGRMRHFKKNNIERTRILRWLGREIVVADLPPLMQIFFSNLLEPSLNTAWSVYLHEYWVA